MSDSPDEEATSPQQPREELFDDALEHDPTSEEVEDGTDEPRLVEASTTDDEPGEFVQSADLTERVGAEERPDESDDTDQFGESVDESDEPAASEGSIEAEDPEERAAADEPRSRRDVMIVGAVLVVLLGALVGSLLLTGGSNDPVYTVFDQEVSRGDLTERLDGFLDPTTIEAVADIDEASAEERSQLAQAISTFITEDAMATAAQAEDIEVTDADVNDQVDEIVDTAFEGDVSQFEAAISESGQTLELVRAQFRTALYAEALVGEVEPVTEEDVQSFYDANFTVPLVSHILVETEEDAQDAKGRIDGGEEFAVVAQEVSADTSAAQGGRLGPLETGVFVEPFEEAALALDPGEVSDPVETQFGWHIITVEPAPALEEVAEQVRSQIEENRLNEQFLALAARLDDEAMITVDPAFGTWRGLNEGGLVPAGISVDEAPAQVPEDIVPPEDSAE